MFNSISIDRSIETTCIAISINTTLGFKSIDKRYMLQGYLSSFMEV